MTKGQAERDAAMLAELARLREVLEPESMSRNESGVEGARAPSIPSLSAYRARQGRHPVDEQHGTEKEK